VIVKTNVPEEEYALYFNASNLLIHTAVDGGFEIPLIEAVFSDLPVLAFDIPIIREVLKDKAIFLPVHQRPIYDFVNDRLVWIEDYHNYQEWVDAILKYYDHKPDYNDLKEYYTKERAYKEYENFYKKVEVLE